MTFQYNNINPINECKRKILLGHSKYCFKYSCENICLHANPLMVGLRAMHLS